MRVSGNVALVTGGGSGLGLAAARRLAAAGARVVMMSRTVDRLNDARAELGADACVVAGDVTRERDVARAVAVATGLGPLRIVVNCAGVAVSGPVLGRRGALPLAEFERAVRVNLVGTFNVVRLAAEAMAGNRVETVADSRVEVMAGGRAGAVAGDRAGAPDGYASTAGDGDGTGERGVVVCTASIAAFDGQRGQAAYAASKAGVAGMTLPLARDLARYGIRVVTVAPGMFDTPMMATVPPEVRDPLVGRTPYPNRLGRPEEFADLVRHIVENPMLNGEVIRIDGAARLGFD
jgi:NAD(P)-dependent dehydrogenase (short-subunit alcohol dehydrogenase family)